MSNFARIGPSSAFSRRQITAQESSAAGHELFKEQQGHAKSLCRRRLKRDARKMLQLCSRAVHAEQ
ncbi:hypothetical protein XCR_1183 [Xanthomonas campestris pv. raphani 756C]|nr:hypothetical protein XCR_1183 [Xanthomonas campestris pv. raphani 756C]